MTEPTTLHFHLLDTPLPSPSLLTLLSNHLPYSLPVLRRLQYAANFSDNNYSNGLGTTPYSHVLFASRHSLEDLVQPFESGAEPEAEAVGKRRHFAAAFVDLSRFPETQAWVYSTLEDHCFFDPGVMGMDGSTTSEVFGPQSQSHSLPEEEANECDELMLALLRRMRTVALQMPVTLLLEGAASEQRQKNWTEARAYLCMDAAAAAGPKVMIGSLAEIHRHRLFLDQGRVHMHKTANIPEEIEWEVCQKWLFRTEALVSSSEKEGELGTTMEKEGLVWDRVRTKEDVRLVQSRTSIKRQEDTLLGLPSVAVRDGEGRMVAWGFMAFDGTLMTLHVEVCLFYQNTVEEQRLIRR